MNYGVYTYQVVDGVTLCHFIAYKMGTVNGVNGFALMSQAEAQALADSMTSPGLTKMVLPLEPDQAITAF